MKKPLLIAMMTVLYACGAENQEPQDSTQTPETTASESTLDSRPSTLVPTPEEVVEATSFLGRPLMRLAELPERDHLERTLAEAEAEYSAFPDYPDALIWLGRRHAYLWQYQEAIAVFTEGVEKFPDDPRIYRHRGHRYITVRNLDAAIADLEKAAELFAGQPDEVEEDGQPNAMNIPRSTLQFNTWYHLGLAHYLNGDFEQAAAAYEECMKVSTNDDAIVATTDWYWMTLMRLGRTEEANALLEPIHADMDVIENDSYLRRILMYKGEVAPDALLDTSNADDLTIATQGYGVGNWYLVNGQTEQAREIFERVIAGRSWSAFGYIAAEAELARWQ